MSDKLKVVIVSGGTGGHLYPGIALGEDLLHRYGMDVIYAVSKGDRSIKILREKGCRRFVEFYSAPFPRRIYSLHKFFYFIWCNIIGLLSAIFFIRREKPDIIVGMGAYVSFPLMLGAKLCNIPTMIHEQNSVPGLANRIISLFADKIALTFTSSAGYFKDNKKIIFTGNPIRREIIERAHRNAEKFGLSDSKFTILVMGGSQGASSINRIVSSKEFLEKINSITMQNIQIIHLTGESDFETVKRNYELLKFPAAVFAFLGDGMPDAYGSCDLVICRAGATTIAEISALGLPAIFIPYPYATDDHQTKNAQAHLSGGREGIIIKESELTADKLADAVEIFYKKNISSPKNSRATPHLLPILPQEVIAKELISLVSSRRKM